MKRNSEKWKKVKSEQQEVDTYEQNMSDFDSFSANFNFVGEINFLSATQPKRQGV